MAASKIFFLAVCFVGIQQLAAGAAAENNGRKKEAPPLKTKNGLTSGQQKLRQMSTQLLQIFPECTPPAQPDKNCLYKKLHQNYLYKCCKISTTPAGPNATIEKCDMNTHYPATYFCGQEPPSTTTEPSSDDIDETEPLPGGDRQRKLPKGRFKLPKIDFKSCHSTKHVPEIGLTVHNQLRSLHNAPPLELDSDLIIKAHRCAVYYANPGQDLDHTCPHRWGSGENIYELEISPNPDQGVKDATNGWYLENFYYNYDLPPCTPQNRLYKEIENFAQMISLTVTKVGLAYCRKGEKMIVVGLYEKRLKERDETECTVFKKNIRKKALRNF